MILFVCEPVIAKNAKPAQITAENILCSSGDCVRLAFELNDGWKIYGPTPGDAGVPLTIELDKESSLNSIEMQKIIWPETKRFDEKILDEQFITHFYDEDFDVLVMIKRPDVSIASKIVLKVRYSACNKTCMMFEELLEVQMPGNIAGNSAFTRIIASLSEILLIMLGAILGGFILNFMPCVFPVLSIKLISLIKYSDQDKNIVKKHLLCTAIGVIFTFCCMAIITIVFKFIGSSTGWGMHFQSTNFLIAFVVVLSLVASNLWGDFHVALPSRLSNMLNFVDVQGGYIGSFFSGIIATLLATPCTAPFVATTMAFALGKNFFIIVITYIFMGFGMAFPYFLSYFYPQLLEKFPKPGKWMALLQKIMAALVLCTAFWLIYILSYHFSNRSIIILVLVLILLRFCIVRSKKLAIGIRSLLLSMVLVSTFVLPYITNNRDHIVEQKLELAWEKFDKDKLLEYIDSDRIILVDVTAEWCITCKVNKLIVLENANLIEALKKQNIVLMRADYTSRDSNISDFLASHMQHGIPFDVLYSSKYKKGLVLPSVLTPNVLMDGINMVRE